MKIHRIILNNFASYGKEEFDLDKFSGLINVYGSTGSGKTTLLVDSITFCLFGRAYGEDKQGSAKLVIRPPLKSARAEIEFSIDGRKYKIIREVYVDKPSLVIFEEFKDGSWKKKLIGYKEIESFIEKQTGFDYATFLNSIVVRQGEVEYLLETDPSKRREIFLRLLNLDFSKHLEKAKERRDSIKEELALLELKIKSHEAEISKEKEYSSKLIEYQKILETLNKELIELLQNEKEIESNINELNEKKQILKNKLEEYKKIKSEYDNLLNAKKEKENEVNKEKARIAEESFLNNKLSMISNEIKEIDEFLSLFVSINSKQALLKKERENLEEKRKSLREMEEYERKLKEIESKKIDLQKLEAEISSIEEKKNIKSRDLNYVRAQLDQLKRIRETLENASLKEPKCPVCGSNLSEERLESLYQHYLEEESKQVEKIKVLERELLELENTLGRKKEERDKILKLLGEETIIKKRLENKLNLIKEIEVYESSVSNLDEEIKSLKSHPLFSKYSTIAERIQERRNELNKELELLRLKVNEIIASKARLEELNKQLGEIVSKISELEKKIQEKPDEKELRDVEDALETFKKNLMEVREKRIELSKEKGRVEGLIEEARRKLNEISAIRQELDKLIAQGKDLRKKLRAYEILCDDVFNERGLPLRFLDDYLKELNEVVNEDFLYPLLKSKQLNIERKEDKIEIVVKDESYSRELSTYSGGEKAAIGLALRLAIAKLLASRRGVLPNFLIIDEGFGPMSLDLRESVLKLLLNLKDEYEKIFIVSHLEDIQENPCFNSVVNVYKDERGISHIRVIR